MIGQTISHYKVLEKLGEGGMGVVYKAQDLTLDRFVALKFLPPHLGQSDEEKKRFIQEAKAASALDHNNIGVIHEISETKPAPGEPGEGRLFIVMACYDGGTLQTRIARQPLSIREVVDIAIQLADGLAKAHSRDIVHRDIKPANILLTEDGQVKIVDFGLAKLLGRTRITKESSTLGTVSYMSPEQTRGLTVDHRTDIWSFGVVVYEMLTGQLPFRGDYDQAVVYSILNEEPDLATSMLQEIPEALLNLIAACLQKEPERRTQHFDELLDELRHIRAGLAAKTDSGSVSRRNLRKQGATRARSWKQAGFLASAVLILAVGLYLLKSPSGSEPIPKPLPRIKQLTSFLGNTYSPSWNPDGSMFAYCTTSGGSMDIYVMSPGGEPHQLTDTPFDEIAPRWSPNGDKIAYVSGRGAGQEIFWIPPSGGRERKVTNTGVLPYRLATAWFRGLGTAPWSPDGTELLFHRVLENGETAIWKIHLDSGEETQLTFPTVGTRDMSASWSPDGQQIAFERSEKGQSRIFSLPAKGGEAELIVDNERFNFAPAWTPDGSKLLFLSWEYGLVFNFWEKSFETELLSPLTNQTSGIMAFSISSRGSIAYSANGHQTDLFWGEVAEDMRAHRNLTRDTRNNFGARVLADGQSVVYHSDRGGNYDLWIYDGDTGEHTQLTDHSAVDVLPDMSPSGQILFVSNRGGPDQLWVIENAGSPPRLFSDFEVPLRADLPVVYCRGPRWSPDGRSIAYIAGSDSGQTLWLLDVGSGIPRSTALYGITDFDWYLDSRLMIYVRRAQDGSRNKELRAANLETGEDILLLTGLYSQPAVTLAGDAVAYLDDTSMYTKNVFILPLTVPEKTGGLPTPAGDPWQLTDGQGAWHAVSFSWAPNGKEFAYTRDSDFGDIFLIENYQ